MDEQVNRKPYVREVSPTRWFLRDRRYMKYMAREVTCIFIGIYTVILLVGIARLAEGQAAYEAFLAALRQPLSIVFQVLTLGFSLYHTTTWFNVTPKALPVQVGEEFVPGGAIAGAHYAVWVLLSCAIFFLAGAL